MKSEIAERYAQGLFELALEDNTVEAKKQQAQTLLETISGTPDFLTFLEAVKVTEEEKKQLVRNVFKDVLDKDMLNFVLLVIDKRRIWDLEGMLEAYIEKADEHLGIQPAVVSSARPLPEEEMERIKTALEKKTGKTIHLRNHVDPRLIAGIKVTVENNVTDVTMKTRIDNMRDQLLKGEPA